MYNRYIGNTGKFVRVEDRPYNPNSHGNGPIRDGPSPIARGPGPAQGRVIPPPVHQSPPIQSAPVGQTAGAVRTPGNKGKSSLLGGLGGGLKGLLGGSGGGLKGLLGGSGGMGNIAGSLKGMFDHLPFGLEAGDLLLLAVLFFFFMESGDEEFIIILAFFAFSVYRDSKGVLPDAF